MTLLRTLALAALVASPTVALASTPQAGVEQKVRRGFFTETDLGTYFDFRTSNGFQVSNAEPYLQLGVGYDLGEHFSVGLQFGLGASAALCLGDVADTGECGVVDGAGRIARDANNNPQILPDNFSNTFFQAQVTYYVPIVERLVFAPRLLLGYQRLDPAPVLDADSNPLNGGFVVGADLGIEYATHMDHFTVGLDVVPRYLIGPNLLSMAIFPRVKYTF